MKEVSLELDAMGYSYMKMQVWVMDASKAKQQNKKQTTKKIHIYNLKAQCLSLVPTAL